MTTDTHKFESRYLDWLIAPLPGNEALYRERSPVHHADALRRPMIFFQGDEDRIVPPSQTETMVEALRRNGVVAQRILLVGGAAQNPAVSSIAAQVFDAPVVVPEPGEYVALGAAVQAAWALSAADGRGQRPDWQRPIVAEPAVDTRPTIRDQYAARQG